VITPNRDIHAYAEKYSLEIMMQNTHAYIVRDVGIFVIFNLALVSYYVSVRAA